VSTGNPTSGSSTRSASRRSASRRPPADARVQSPAVVGLDECTTISASIKARVRRSAVSGSPQ
jgi:hypothetical protein